MTALIHRWLGSIVFFAVLLLCLRCGDADARIASEIEGKLDGSASLSRAEIVPDVTGGFVTLRGSVENDFQRQEAEELARRTEGVTGVDNRIEVEPSSELPPVASPPPSEPAPAEGGAPPESEPVENAPQ